MPDEGRSGHDARFKKPQRLRKRWEFLAVQRRGRKIHLLDLLVILLPRQGHQRMGITVSSKVGGAVVRNRIKRLLREAWRQDSGLLPADLDIVFIAKKRAVGTSLAGLRRQLGELGRRLGRSS